MISIDRKSLQLYSSINPIQMCVLQVLLLHERNGGCLDVEPFRVAQILNLQESTVRQSIAVLERMGIVGRVGEQYICQHSPFAAQLPKVPPGYPEGKNESKVVRFVKPTVEQVAAYCEEKGYSFDPHHFVDHYESCGWMIGKKPMKDWKAACRNWKRNESKYERKQTYTDSIDARRQLHLAAAAQTGQLAGDVRELVCLVPEE